MNYCSVRLKPLISNLLTYILVLIIAVPHTAMADTKPGHVSKDQQNLTDLQILQKIQEAQEDYKKSLIEYIDIHFELKGKLDSMIEIEGLEAVIEKVNLNSEDVQPITREGVATVEASIIDGALVYRVKPADPGVDAVGNENLSFRKKGSQMAFIFVDEAIVEKTSKHLLDLYIPRQHIASGTERPDTIDGRDVIVVWMSYENNKADLQKFEKPKPYSSKWWKEYRQSVLKKPTKSDGDFAKFLVPWAFFLGCIPAFLQVYTDPGLTMTDFEWKLPVYNAFFSGFIGWLHRTYTNWGYLIKSKNLKTEILTTLKTSVPTYTFLILLMSTTVGFSSINFLDVDAEGAKIAFNTLNLTALGKFMLWFTVPLGSTYAKNSIKGVFGVREKARANVGDVNMSKVTNDIARGLLNFLPGVHVPENVKISYKLKSVLVKVANLIPLVNLKVKDRDILYNKRALEYQLWGEMFVNVLKNGDYMQWNIYKANGVPLLPIPISKVLLFASILPFKYFTYWYGNKYYPNEAKEMGLTVNPFSGLDKYDLKIVKDAKGKITSAPYTKSDHYKAFGKRTALLPVTVTVKTLKIALNVTRHALQPHKVAGKVKNVIENSKAQYRLDRKNTELEYSLVPASLSFTAPLTCAAALN